MPLNSTNPSPGSSSYEDFCSYVDKHFIEHYSKKLSEAACEKISKKIPNSWKNTPFTGTKQRVVLYIARFIGREKMSLLCHLSGEKKSSHFFLSSWTQKIFAKIVPQRLSLQNYDPDQLRYKALDALENACNTIFKKFSLTARYFHVQTSQNEYTRTELEKAAGFIKKAAETHLSPDPKTMPQDQFHADVKRLLVEQAIPPLTLGDVSTKVSEIFFNSVATLSVPYLVSNSTYSLASHVFCFFAPCLPFESSYPQYLFTICAVTFWFNSLEKSVDKQLEDHEKTSKLDTDVKKIVETNFSKIEGKAIEYFTHLKPEEAEDIAKLADFRNEIKRYKITPPVFKSKYEVSVNFETPKREPKRENTKSELADQSKASKVRAQPQPEPEPQTEPRLTSDKEKLTSYWKDIYNRSKKRAKTATPQDVLKYYKRMALAKSLHPKCDIKDTSSKEVVTKEEFKANLDKEIALLQTHKTTFEDGDEFEKMISSLQSPEIREKYGV